MTSITIGVLALQGAFSEHLQLLQQASDLVANDYQDQQLQWHFIEVRKVEELDRCDGLILPGGESTTISLVAARSGILEPLREYVKVSRKPVWGTCAGLILLAESANRTKATGQELLGGLDVRVNRNHFGRQVESFEAELDLPFLKEVVGPDSGTDKQPFRSVFIRAPVVEKILEPQSGIQEAQSQLADTVVAPSKAATTTGPKVGEWPVEVMCRLPGRAKALRDREVTASEIGEEGDIVAVRQGNVFGTSFHPELTGDARIHAWWMKQVVQSVQ
ncbi:hypothetical protein AAFC00_000147 [Neodothiora populina]|uniref:glutaminase n=1 Tax=Neodothiora populina TaxID=2781224 RepID=A0ABR3P1X7_9PEZI